ncbi:MAG: RNA polymerase sigma factor [Acidobacteria bacterium]|nr:RNA polymerase sigma factor [Acidobacteriota bacterium]
MEERPVIEQFLATRTEEAFCALFEVVAVRAQRYFRLRGLDAATAEELTQNVLLKVYRQAGELREPERFYGWLFAIARNEMISYWRGTQARIETVGFDALPPSASESLIAENDALSALRLTEWLQALDPAERDLVLLRFVEGLSYEELSEALSLPLGTVKWRIFQARKKMAQVFQRMRPRDTQTERQRLN